MPNSFDTSHTPLQSRQSTLTSIPDQSSSSLLDSKSSWSFLNSRPSQLDSRQNSTQSQHSLSRLQLTKGPRNQSQSLSPLSPDVHLGPGAKFPPLTKGLVRLYSCATCPYALRVRLVLTAKNIPFEMVNIKESSPPEWFKSLAVPCVEYHDGRHLSESLIICEYLDVVYPETRLSPEDPYVNASQRVLIDRVDRIRVPLFKILRSEEKQNVWKDDLESPLNCYEKNLEQEFFGGAEPKMIDFMVWPIFRLFELKKVCYSFLLHKEKYPRLVAYIQRMKSVPAVKESYVESWRFDSFFDSLNRGLTSEPNFDIVCNEPIDNLAPN